MDYDPAETKQRALEGDWLAQVTAVTRPDLSADLLAAIIAQPKVDEQVQLAIVERRDITVQTLDWAAGSDSAVVLHRVIGHDLAPLRTVRSIRDRAADLDRDIWEAVVEHADRVLQRRLETGR
jgi:hypothetical protein